MKTPAVAERSEAGRCYVVAAWVNAIGRALDAAGCNGARLLAEAGFDLERLDSPTQRCPIAQEVRLWQLAVAATGDPAFGLKVASHIRHTSFHALSFGLAASSTLREAFERASRYLEVASDAVGFEFQRVGEHYHFLIHRTTSIAIEAIDALMALQLRMARSLSGRDFSPLLIELRRPRPSRLEDFERLLRAPLRFEAAHDRMVFDRASIERRLEEGNPELARQHDLITMQFLMRVGREDVRSRVREVLMRRLEGSEPSQEEIAEQLCMSARTLQRKLGETGTTYKAVLDETREALALAYLASPQRSVSEIAYSLGFSSASCFTRAFRRWTGESPSNWRERQGAPEVTTVPAVAPARSHG